MEACLVRHSLFLSVHNDDFVMTFTSVPQLAFFILIILLDSYSLAAFRSNIQICHLHALGLEKA